MVVRLNNKAYDEKKFVKNGISHTDIFFEDGSTPKKVIYLNYYLYLTIIQYFRWNQELIDKFLAVAEKEKGALAVHCKVNNLLDIILMPE